MSPSRLDHFEEIASRLEIKGSNNPDRLVAGDDGDVLVGKAGNDTLVGGAGADTLKGGAGVDTYEIGQPDGRDVIRDDGGTLDLTDINAGAVGFFKDGYDLVVSGSSSNFAAIRGFFDKNLAKSELSAGDYADWSFAFADGTLDSADVIDRMGSDDFPDPPPPDTTDEKTARSVTLVEDTSLPPVAPGDEIHVSELFDFEGGNVNDFDGFYLVDETTADHSGYFVDEDGDRAQRDDDIAIALSPDGYDEMVNGVDNQPFGSPEYEYWADAFSAYDVEWQDAFYRGGEGENDVEIVPFLFDGDKSYGHFEMDLLLSEDRRLEIDIESTREPNDAPSLGASAVSVSSAADGFTAPLTPSDPDGDLLRLDIELTSAPADAQVRWAGEPLSSGRTLTLSEGAADAQVSVAGAVRGDSLTFRVRADDGRATSGWTTFTAEVTNGAPAAGDDSIEVGKDVAKPLPVDRLVANDSDADGDTLSIASRTDPGNGTLSTDADGQLIYTPDAGFTGTDSFTYTVADGHGGTDTATVTLDVDRPQITASAPGARVFGRSGPDVIEGTDGDETLLGGPGADEISGGAGHDTASYLDSEEGVAVGLAGDPGRGGTAEGDVLSGIEALVGSAFDDRLSGDAGANDLEGAGGDDTLAGRGGADDLAGGAGRDAASYAGAASAVVAELWTGGGSAGAADGDTYSSIEDLIGSAHADRLVGDGGDNVLNGGADGDFLSGGPGRDTASYAGAAEGVTAELWTGRGARGEAAGDTYRAIENLTGSDHDDRLVGDGGDNVLTGGAGADWLSGGPGIDTASYADAPGAVDVKLWRNAKLASEGGEPGHASGDVFTSVENVVGSDFDDSLIGDAAANLLIGGAGADRLSGGPGGDTASYAPSTGAVTVELWSGDGQGGTAEGDSLHAIEHLIGSDHDDKLVGDAGDNTLAGGAGADQLTGGPGQDTASYADAATGITAKLWMRAGYTGAAEGDRYRAIENLAGSDHDDRLVGDAGDNVLTGRAGADELLGSSGTDTASYADADGGVTVKLWTGAGTRGEADGDRLSGIENLTGSDHADRLVGDAGANVLDGRGGDDQLLGSVGPDTFVFAPGDGHDTVSGWTDGDRLDVQAFGFAGRADALDKAVAAGDGVRIDLGPESQVTIKGIALEDLEARDFAI